MIDLFSGAGGPLVKVLGGGSLVGLILTALWVVGVQARELARLALDRDRLARYLAARTAMRTDDPAKRRAALTVLDKTQPPPEDHPDSPAGL
ncbi:hypothetical protein [Nocardia sp. NPDC051570]|uniref:hypothetical protein n=1 Tax=Nocardia sp. NPDC051570 TaxID=3364324 RepID=UPI0037A6B420